MISASLEEERDLPAQPRRINGPVLASVVLHGTLLYLIARVGVSPAESTIVAERPFVKVVVDLRASPGVAERPAQEIPKPEAIATQPPAAADTPAPPVTAQTPVVEADIEETASVAGPDAVPEAWTPARIRSAIQEQASDRRSAATTTWLTECLLEQKQHGTRDCEQLLNERDYASASMRAARAAGAGAFASIVRPDSDWRLVQRFMRNNALMEDLAEQGGVAGELATARLLLNNEYMRYLTGNGQDPLWESMNSGFRADVLHGARLSLPSNVPFQCAEEVVRENGDRDMRNVPCVYEFTGFVIKRPELPVEANAFRVVPIVPGSQQ